MTRRVVGVAAIVTVLCVLSATTALAAINATVSTSETYPGQRVQLDTDNYGNSTAYDYLASQTPQAVYLIRTDEELREVAQFGKYVCATNGQTFIGQLHWKNHIGSLVFTISDLTKGDYHFLIDVGLGYDPPCWRIDGLHGPLTMSLTDRPVLAASVPSAAGKATLARQSLPFFTVIAMGSLAVILVGIFASTIIHARHHRGSQIR